MTQPVELTLPPALWAYLQSKAEAEGLSVAEVIRTALVWDFATEIYAKTLEAKKGGWK